MYLGKKVDLLITYVNFKDEKWRNDYTKVAHTKMNPVIAARFRSFGTLRYLIRGVAKFMPYVDRVVLIVSSETQVPKWINKNAVEILTHDKFMPLINIPTFNSCAIESCFHRINNLDPYIIYTNDDIYPIAPSTIDDFFTQSLPNTNFKFYKGYGKDNMFRQQCKNGADLIYNTLKKKRLISETKENPKFFKPDHCMSAMTFDTLRTVGYLCGEELRRSLTTFRSMNNINQHIYLYYQYFTEKYYNKPIDYTYVTFQNGIESICNEIINPMHKFICINDNGLSESEYDSIKTKLQFALKSVLPEKCKYEN